MALRGILSLKSGVFCCIVLAVFGAVYEEMKALGMTWDVFLRALAFYGIPGILLMVGYEVLQRRGVKKSLFFKMLLFGFIFVAAPNFIYKQAERVGVSWLWFSNRWVFDVLWVLVLGLVFALIDRGAKRFGITWFDFLYVGGESSVVPQALFWKRMAIGCIVLLCFVCALVAAQAFLFDKEKMLGLVCIESCFRQW
ncbi:hypothetical protein [Bartonella raoultii]|uniref:hypothetical protein n=1 Tax=Bartonella raoultii TaxID=1457020 RepID=UPI001FEDEB41|nr:hypothetical protein [Bartonella raoultii]